MDIVCSCCSLVQCWLCSRFHRTIAIVVLLLLAFERFPCTVRHDDVRHDGVRHDDVRHDDIRTAEFRYRERTLDSTDSVTYSRSRFIRRLMQHRDRYRDNLILQRIHHARKRNATCMDGSDAKYYLSRRPHSIDWVIHLQGGGSCVSRQECRERAKGPLGSSLLLSDRITGEYTLSDDPNINPTFHAWNKVVIPYCSGDVFVGRAGKHTHPFRIPQLGHYIIMTVIEDLIRKHHLRTKYAEILFGGTSAGGVGVLANIDRVQELTSPARVRGYNDGGWFTLYPNFEERFSDGSNTDGLPQFFNLLTELFDKNWRGFVDSTCRMQMPKAAACLYGELAISYISTPIYVMVSQWDTYQLTSMVTPNFRTANLPLKTHEETVYMAGFGNNTFRSVSRLLSSKKTGVFSPACFSHTFFTSCIDGIMCGFSHAQKYSIQDTTAYSALSLWFKSKGRDGSYVDEPGRYPSCNPSCCSVYCSLCLRPSSLTKQDVRMRRRKKERRKIEHHWPHVMDAPQVMYNEPDEPAPVVAYSHHSGGCRGRTSGLMLTIIVIRCMWFAYSFLLNR